MTTPPLPRKADIGVIDPIKEDFSAFVFKIQANMNKAHRDRIAFMRICSGKFDAGMEVYHVQGDQKMRLSQPQQMMAQERQDRGRGLCRRYHRRVRSGHFLHR